jgi:hypothetical protein
VTITARARQIAGAALSYVAEVSSAVAAVAHVARYALGSVADVPETDGPPTLTTDDVQRIAREAVSDLAERVASLEARHPARVMERRRAPSSCDVCGSTVVEVMEGVGPIGDSLPALCAGCGQPWYAHKTAKVIP